MALPREDQGHCKTASGDNLMDLLTVDQASELIGISVETLNQWRSRKKGPDYLKIEGRLVRYRREDLIKYLESCRVSASERRHK
jgi:excisionase family DNA binding protein